MKRKFLLLATAVLLSMASAFAQDVEINGIYYYLDSGNAKATVISSPLGYSGDIIIPNTVKYEQKNYDVTTIGNGAFWGTPLTSVVIGDNVTTIEELSFSDCPALTSVTLGNKVTTIGRKSFFQCTALTSVVLGEKVTTIGEAAFSTCYSLISITLPKSVTTIGEGAFSSCSALTSINVENGNAYFSSTDGVLFNKDKTTLNCYPAGKTAESYTIPNSVTTIGNSAFSCCQKLTSVTLGNNVTTIEEYAFFSCSSLTSITLPKSVTTIGSCAFFGCFALTSINVESGNPNFSSENGVLFSKDKSTLFYYPAGKTAESYTIPNSVTTIGGYAFYRCELLTTVVIPNSVTTIRGEAFQSCSALKSVTIGNSVTKIGWSAFSHCEKLTSITIPNSVTEISPYAFGYCGALTLVTNLNPKPIGISSSLGVFDGTNISVCTLKVLKSSVSAYKAADVWKKFKIVGGDYLVTTSVNNYEFGYITGNETLYVAYEEANLTAVPRNNYKFVNWTIDGVVISTDNPYSFTVTEDIELVANFESNVGVVETQCIASLQVYPNPTPGQLKIEGEEIKIENVEIFDIFGKKVLFQHSLMSPETIIDITHLPNGIYFLQIQTEQGLVIKKIIKH